MNSETSAEKSGNQPEKTEYRHLKYASTFVAAVVVGTVVGSGIVKDSVLWAASGGTWAFAGLFLVWGIFFVVATSMTNNASIMPDNGGTYAWARKTLGRFWGVQVGWIYIVGYGCLSVVLTWLASQYTLSALAVLFPEGNILSDIATASSYILPLFFIIFFTTIFGMGKKATTQIIIAFFIVKVAMWLTIVGIGYIHFEPAQFQNVPNTDPLGSTLSVASLSLFAMLGFDSCSVFSNDVHDPGKNMRKGVRIGMLVIFLLYTLTVGLVLGLTGQAGAEAYTATGISGIFLDLLKVPQNVLLVFIIISVIGTLCITMYLVVRLSGAMSLNDDFFFSLTTQKRNLELQQSKPKGKKRQRGAQRMRIRLINEIEVPPGALVAEVAIYILFFLLIEFERSFGTMFVLYAIYYLGINATLVVQFFIALTNFKAHQKKIAPHPSGIRKFIAVLGMILSLLILAISIYFMWVQPAFPLPGPGDSYAWEFWQLLGKIFPIFMFVPGLLFWATKRKAKPPQIAIENTQEKQKK